ncbi:hypothetical protein [Actinocorallia sp. A-T 12471]|uniref:hypothetical protein n=1 Tax=Actinocorallia sp. A-T 12471 TaxID=3089813 RepID=UPI0029CCA654|nr:hypothetical protein [Actinocorallia sp. A-T 12471]MDX6742531.1 hypothetical protein [Actinocorallia sp. A-T 12471]
MKNSTKALVCASAFAPVLALVGTVPATAAGPAAAAGKEGGPAAILAQGTGLVASQARPVVQLVEGVEVRKDGMDVAGGLGVVQQLADSTQQVTSLLSGVSANPDALNLTNLGSRCAVSPEGELKGATAVRGTLAGRRLPKTPAVGTRLPLADGAYAILNHQTRDALGGEVVGLRLVDKAGEATDLAVSRCSTERRAPMPADPVGSLLNGLLGGKNPVGDLLGGAVGGNSKPGGKPGKGGGNKPAIKGGVPVKGGGDLVGQLTGAKGDKDILGQLTGSLSPLGRTASGAPDALPAAVPDRSAEFASAARRVNDPVALGTPASMLLGPNNPLMKAVLGSLTGIGAAAKSVNPAGAGGKLGGLPGLPGLTQMEAGQVGLPTNPLGG